jgi:hypothetical protein
VLLGERVEPVDPRRQLLDRSVHPIGQRRRQQHTQQHEQRQDPAKQQTGRAASAPSSPLVQPHHGWLQRERQ